MTGTRLNHVGLTVRDIHQVSDWYVDVLDLELVLSPTTIESGSGELSARFEAIVGDFDEVRMAQLRDDRGHGIELFEYSSVSDDDSNWTPRDRENWPHSPGLNHFAITHDDLDSLISRVKESGGGQHIDLKEAANGVQTAYLTDPWDNIIEVSSGEFDELTSQKQ